MSLRGLIGKFGVMPTRSRHCNGEQVRRCHWEFPGKAGRAKNQSQENCLFDSHRQYLRAMGRGLQTACVFPLASGSPVRKQSRIHQPGGAGIFCFKSEFEQENRSPRRGRIEQESRRESEGLKERERNPILVQGDGSTELQISYSVFLLRTLS